MCPEWSCKTSGESCENVRLILSCWGPRSNKRKRKRTEAGGAADLPCRHSLTGPPLLSPPSLACFGPVEQQEKKGGQKDVANAVTSLPGRRDVRAPVVLCLWSLLEWSMGGFLVLHRLPRCEIAVPSMLPPPAARPS